MSMVSTKKIDGRTFVVIKHNPIMSIRLLAKTMKALAPALGGITNFSDFKDFKNFDQESALKMVSAMGSSLNSEDLESLINECLLSGRLKVDGKEVQELDESVFPDFVSMLKVVWFVLEANFKDVMGKLIAFGKTKEAKQVNG